MDMTPSDSARQLRVRNHSKLPPFGFLVLIPVHRLHFRREMILIVIMLDGLGLGGVGMFFTFAVWALVGRGGHNVALHDGGFKLPVGARRNIGAHGLCARELHLHSADQSCWAAMPSHSP